MAQARKRGQAIAFTNGCFDLIHAGHVSYLQKAKGNGRLLIVGLNSDRSVERIKGANRPIQNQQNRAAVLAALECVDYVTIFSEDTPYKLIDALRPDVLIKGADWKGKEVVGREVVEANGGKVEFIKYIEGQSTSQIMDKIIRSWAK